MTTLKKFNETTGEWEYVLSGPKGTTGATGAKGDKGDPGGFTTASAFTGDLNTLVTPGLYMASSTATNRPNAQGTQHHIEVTGRANSYLQRATQVSSSAANRSWTRVTIDNGATWTAWVIDGEKPVADHVAQTDPHTQYAQKGALNTFTATQRIDNVVPLVITNPSAPANTRRWSTSISASTGTLSFLSQNDSAGDTVTVLRLDRNGNALLGGSQHVSGTGSPEGVVSASVGSRYVDTAATNGAVEWIKASGTGSTGWKVVYGDTGWRTVAQWNSSGQITSGALDAGWGPHPTNAGSLRFRRTGDTVEVSASFIMATQTSPTSATTLPVGFRPTFAQRVLSDKWNANNVGNGTATGWGIEATGYFGRGGNSSILVNDYYVGVSHTFTTRDPWPTTLPGTAA